MGKVRYGMKSHFALGFEAKNLTSDHDVLSRLAASVGRVAHHDADGACEFPGNIYS